MKTFPFIEEFFFGKLILIHPDSSFLNNGIVFTVINVQEIENFFRLILIFETHHQSAFCVKNEIEVDFGGWKLLKLKKRKENITNTNRLLNEIQKNFHLWIK
jgi:hypothetical protein